MTACVFQHERQREFDQWWQHAKHQYKFADDPKKHVTGLQGDFMLICLRAYEQGRQDESADWCDLQTKQVNEGQRRQAIDAGN